MKNRIKKAAIILGYLALGYLLAGCQQLPETEELDQVPQQLKIKARTASEEALDYPLHLYVFDTKGRCVASQVLQTAEETIFLHLVPNTYKCVLISDASGGYVLPEDPQADSAIRLESHDGAQAPLMVGKADVQLEHRNTTLNIIMRYAVTALTANVQDIPEEVTEVHLLLSPLHASLYLNGEYGTDSYQIDIPCKKDAGNVWRTDTVYSFPGMGPETLFSVELTYADGKRETYAYTYPGKPEANRPFNITGNYAGAISVDGSFIIEGWGAATDVSFTFGTAQQEDEPADPPTEDTGTTPQVGQIWNDGIVVDVDGDNVLVMSTEEWIANVWEVESILAENPGWHVPTYEEAKLLRAAFNGKELNELNNRIVEYDGTLSEIDDEERYLCTKEEVYYSFLFEEGSSITKAGSKRSYCMRVVKIVESFK